MDIRDILKPSAETAADLLEGAQASKNIVDAHVQVGFTRKEAMQVLTTIIGLSIEARAATEWMERQARGEFDGGE